jgi:LysM repeat protein
MQAQEQPIYKEVILDGRPARLNLNTGEVSLIALQKPEDSVVSQKPDSRANTVNPSITKYHTVKQGESLLDISRTYNVSLNKLKTLNGLETTLVDTGQVLLVFETENQQPKQPVTDKITSTAPLGEETNIHVVKKGETLYSISKSYGLSVQDLKSRNNLSSNLITIGQELTIKETSKKNESVNSIVVKKGDTLYSFSKRFNTTIEELKRLNNLDTNLILVGQTLRIR